MEGVCSPSLPGRQTPTASATCWISAWTSSAKYEGDGYYDIATAARRCTSRPGRRGPTWWRCSSRAAPVNARDGQAARRWRWQSRPAWTRIGLSPLARVGRGAASRGRVNRWRRLPVGIRRGRRPAPAPDVLSPTAAARPPTRPSRRRSRPRAIAGSRAGGPATQARPAPAGTRGCSDDPVRPDRRETSRRPGCHLATARRPGAERAAGAGSA